MHHKVGVRSPHQVARITKLLQRTYRDNQSCNIFQNYKGINFGRHHLKAILEWIEMCILFLICYLKVINSRTFICYLKVINSRTFKDFLKRKLAKATNSKISDDNANEHRIVRWSNSSQGKQRIPVTRHYVFQSDCKILLSCITKLLVS